MAPKIAQWNIQKLDRSHIVEAFNCGYEDLNRFISRFALINQSSGSAQTYVAVVDDKVVGYYSLTVGAVAHSEAPARMTKGLARHPIPVMLLARLAVDNEVKSKGLGATLLQDALARTVQASDIAGIRAVIVHAKDNNAKSFYEYFDFDPCPTDPYHLYLLIKDLRNLSN